MRELIAAAIDANTEAADIDGLFYQTDIDAASDAVLRAIRAAGIVMGEPITNDEYLKEHDFALVRVVE